MAGSVKVSEIKKLVSDALANDDSVDAFVRGRIWTEFPDLTDLGDPSYPLVAMSFRSGRLLYSGDVRTMVFEVWAISRVSSGQASEVYDAVVTALQAELLTITGLAAVVYCQETQSPVDTHDSETRTWAANGRWVARAIGK